MKKITALLLAIVMIFGLAACKSDAPEPPVSTEGTENPEDNLRQPTKLEDTLCLVFEDDNTSFTMSRSLLDIASQKMYEMPLDGTNGKYDAVLKKVTFDIYDANNKENEHYFLYFWTDYDLFSQEDLVLTINRNTAEAEDLKDIYPADIMHTIQRMDYEKYGVTVICSYMRIYEGIATGDQFKFTGTLTIEDKTTDNVSTNVYLRETGAGVTLSLDKLLKYMGKTRQDVKPGDTLIIESTEIFVSGHETFVSNNEEIVLEINEDSPDDVILDLVYEDALNRNNQLLNANEDVSQYCYVWAGIKYINDDEDQYYHLYIRVNLIEGYTNQATEPTSEA